MQIQLDTLERHGRVDAAHPLPAVDPEGDAFPLHGASRVLRRLHPLRQAPAADLPVPALARGLRHRRARRPVRGRHGGGGLPGRAAGRTVPARGAGRSALWLVGAGSPLLFDAFVMHAHTIAAATAVLAGLGRLRALERHRARWAVLAVAGGAGHRAPAHRGRAVRAALGAALLGLGVAAGGDSAGRRRASPSGWRARRRCSSIAGGRAPWRAALHRRRARRRTAGRRTSRAGVSSLAYTLVMPGYRGVTPVEAITAVGALLVIVGVVLVHRRPGDQGAVAVPVARRRAAARARRGWSGDRSRACSLAFCIGIGGLLLAAVPARPRTASASVAGDGRAVRLRGRPHPVRERWAHRVGRAVLRPGRAAPRARWPPPRSAGPGPVGTLAGPASCRARWWRQGWAWPCSR